MNRDEVVLNAVQNAVYLRRSGISGRGVVVAVRSAHRKQERIQRLFGPLAKLVCDFMGLWPQKGPQPHE